MIRTLLLAGTATALTPPASSPPLAPATTRVASFAATLAERPFPTGSAAWPYRPATDLRAAIAASTPDTRQAARWAYAISMIGRARPEAIGVLDVMRADDPDLALVPAWVRARGVALAQIGHSDAALGALADPALRDDAESCLWRLRALAETDRAAAALDQLRCAMPALRGRTADDRRDFVLAVGRSAIAIGRAAPALAWLTALPDRDAAANLLRGKAYALLGQMPQSRLRLDRVTISGTPAERADAALTSIEGRLATRTISFAEARRRLDHLLFTWRGDAIEARGLALSMRLAVAMHDVPAELASGAALFRYGHPGPAAGALATRLQNRLAGALAPGSTLPLARAAGLFWDYRDLAPVGPEGDRMVDALVDRLQNAGLYARAADLLQHRLTGGPRDVEQGPLSVRIASLRILAGMPDQAIRVLRQTDTPAYPAAMLADRHRVEAAALDLLDQPAAALATLQDVPDAATLATEIYWQRRDWSHLAQAGAPVLPAPGRLSDVDQAIVLRHAIALAMLGHEPALAALRARYAAGFATLPTAPAFAMLTAKVGTVDPAALGKAMAALPAASPSGTFGDLIEQGKAALGKPTS